MCTEALRRQYKHASLPQYFSAPILSGNILVAVRYIYHYFTHTTTVLSRSVHDYPNEKLTMTEIMVIRMYLAF